jgi:hypothetical protein
LIGRSIAGSKPAGAAAADADQQDQIEIEARDTQRLRGQMQRDSEAA